MESKIMQETLSQFVTEEIEFLKSFEKYWETKNKQYPLDYPMTIIDFPEELKIYSKLKLEGKI